MRVGVFGGTFDPPHVAHVAVAKAVRDALTLDLVLFVVSNDPWQKSGRRTITPADVRMAMTEAAVNDEVGLRASRLEVDRGGVSYTVDTLRALHAAEPAATLFLILGADAAAGLRNWREADALPELAELVVVTRPGATVEHIDPAWVFHGISDVAMDVSSTEVRRRVAGGESIEGLVTPAVAEMIRREGLYRAPEIGR